MSSQVKLEFVVFVADCKFSKNFLSKLKSKPELAKKFNIVDINTLQVIPDEIEEVPCVYDGSSVRQGKQAFDWLNDKMSEYLSAANDGLMYSFLEGNEEEVFGNYSLIGQQNGSAGMGDQSSSANMNDPTRMAKLENNENKNRTLDSLMAARSLDMNSFKT
jgi:hypothetical protein